MSSLLFTTLPSNDLGLLTRSLPIASELAARGHAVAFCSPGLAPSLLVAEAGFQNLLPHHPLYALLAGGADPMGLLRTVMTSRRDFGGLRRFLGSLLAALPTHMAPPGPDVWNVDQLAATSGMADAAYVRAMCDPLMELIVGQGVDVVIDFWNPFACIAARALGKPLVSVIQADTHPLAQGFIWWRDPPADLPTAVPALNEVLAGYGLPPVGSVTDLCAGDPTLVVGMPETDPLPPEADVTYVGALLWQRPGARLPDWVTGLSADRPLVWVYSGNPRYMPMPSPVDSAVVLAASVAALASEDLQVVLTTGHHRPPRRLRRLPPNFRYAPYLPGLAMAARSDLLIHHGGYGSCQTGLTTGTPAVIIPTYSERESNARRVAALGAGEYLLPTVDRLGRKHLEPECLREKVRQVLADPSYAANASGVGERLRAYGGAPHAARLIGDFVRARVGGSRVQPIVRTAGRLPR
jgi:UDP:flavonoid glycosyltransferase YjiC (YdhE family)